MDEQEREQLRTERNLRPLRSEEEGSGVHKLANGVYGFSYAPATETPLFTRKSYHSYEVHKLADGTAHLLAYLTAEEAARIRGGDVDVEATAYPDPHGKADTLVTIAFNRILTSLYKPIRQDGNALPLKIASV